MTGQLAHSPMSGNAKAKKWRVIHACEQARDILPVIEGQLAAGMRPYLVTPQEAGAAELYLSRKDDGEQTALSLLRAWQDVRNWRKSLLECGAEESSALVHTHSFASGMAGVRNLPCVVYGLSSCIEELAVSVGLCEPGSWMGRSFRVAEQFVLTRAQAVVVHSLAMKSAAEERGAAPENIFLIPDPVSLGDESHASGLNSSPRRFGLEHATVSYFVPHPSGIEGAELPRGSVMMLEAFAGCLRELPQSRMLIEVSSRSLGSFLQHSERLGLGAHAVAVAQNEVSEALLNSTIVVAPGDAPADLVQARKPNTACLQALAMGKPLLAADVARNRDCSPEGRGCLWFEDNDVLQLAHRMVFLGQHPDFRTALGASGRAYLLETRNSAAVGRQYEAAYRHAHNRRRTGGPGQLMNSLLPLNCAV